MELSINAKYLRKMHGTDEKRSVTDCIRMCYEAGFRVLDILPDVLSDSWEAELSEIQRAAEKYGMTPDQGHIPMNRYTQIPADEFRIYKFRSIDAAAALGLKRLVLHADEYINPDVYDAKAHFAANYEDLLPVVDYAKKRGIDIAIENVFEDHYKAAAPEIRTRYTSELAELLEIIDRFNDPAVTCCWDFGHGQVAFGDGSLEQLKQVGSRLSCTHVHDNYYGQDLHLPIFFGRIDWEGSVRWLYESGYKGNFTYEFVYGSIPEPLLPDYLKMAYRSAAWLLEIARPS